MCLYTTKLTPEDKIGPTIIAWKVLEVGPKGGIRCYWQGTQGWRKGVRKTSRGPGFHAFTQKRRALSFIVNTAAEPARLRVFKVKLEDVRSYGTQWGRNAVAAKHCTIISDALVRGK